MREPPGDHEDLAVISAFMLELAAEPIDGPPPNAAFIWWRGQLARRWDAEHRASVLVRLDECICAGLAALAGAGLAAWRWVASPLNAASGAASIGGVLILVTSAIFVMSDAWLDGLVHLVTQRSGDLKSPSHRVTK